MSDSEELDMKKLDEMDDKGQGHVYFTLMDYGDLKFNSFKDMVLGTKAYCDEKNIPYPDGGLMYGEYYDFYENEDEYEDDWIPIEECCYPPNMYGTKR